MINSSKGTNQVKVTLLSYTMEPKALIAAAINQCYSEKSGRELMEEMDDNKRERLIKQVISSGHTSTIEHGSFTFSIEGVSRVTEVQMVRHRIGSYSIKSGRYNKSHTNFVIPAKIKNNEKAMVLVEKFKADLERLISEFAELGIAYEDIRYLTPQGTRTNIMVTMNARSLFNFFQERMCNRAQWEIRTVAHLMHKELMSLAPELFKFAGPTCKSEGICWQTEKMSCELWKTIGAERRDRVQL